MKDRKFYILIFVCVASFLMSSIVFLISCVNRKINYFVTGSFISIDGEKKYYLEIDSITKYKYISSNNLNVIEDKVLNENNYFSINFYTYDEDGNIIRIDFYNLTDTNPRTNVVPIGYIDENENEIVPCYPSDNARCYLIVYQSSYIYFERRISQ